MTVCIAARERFLRLHPSTPTSELVILGTNQTHSLGAKAALILGVEFVAIKTKAEDDWSLRGDALEEELKLLEGKGKKPFILRKGSFRILVSLVELISFLLLVATVGSTSTGAIDNIAEITAVSKPSSIVLHLEDWRPLLDDGNELISLTLAAAHHPDLFLHVDAAWAGVFLSLEECRKECWLDAINARAKDANEAKNDAAICAGGEVHSFCTNLHK